MAEILKDDQTSAFIEQKCCIKHNDQNFCSGGSYLCIRADTGKMEGIMYAQHKPDENCNSYISSWDGTLKIRAIYGKYYRDNFGGKRCNVYFRYAGRYFWGKWYGMEWSDIIRCKEITKKSYFGHNYSTVMKEEKREMLKNMEVKTL